VISRGITRRRCLAGLAGLPVTAALGAAPPRSLVALDERGFRDMLAAHRGKVLLVDFWATWCAPCRDELPKLVAIYSSYRPRGLVFAAISCDEPEQESKAAAFASQQGAPTPRYIRRAQDDDKFINAIDPKWSGALPALFLFDRAGRQALSLVGETDMRRLEAALKRTLA
jgi:thiol-disulfide isomerase/thioredoxin